MRTCLDCVPCFFRQALEASRMATDDLAIHEEVLRRIAREVGSLDMVFSPPTMGQRIHRLVRELTGVNDPYLEVKQRTTRLALELEPMVRQRIQEADSPLEMAARMAIAGNTIDFGVDSRVRNEAVGEVLERAASAPLYGDPEAFAADAESATSILYIADNAGEIVFDRVLVERLGRARVTVVVRGRPILNDALLADATAAGLVGFDVMDNGSDAPGTILDDCTPEIRTRFAAADMVIAKGQGNYETLSGSPRPVWFVLMAKCEVISHHIGCEPGALVLVRR